VRCPQCGSTDAGSDESQSFIDLTWMQCGDCGHGELQDHYQISFDWNADIEMTEHEELPEYIKPLEPGEDFASGIARARSSRT
jgi:hypothetical protein